MNHYDAFKVPGTFKDAKVEGRLIPWDDSFYVHVTKLSIVEGEL